MKEKTKIFLVEDDPNLGLLTKDSLEINDFEVELFVNGEEAWKAYKKGAFDICLLDIMMPVKDGFTLAKEIRSIDTEIPIIFLTAKNMNADKIEGLKMGADDYITKPYAMEELVLRIQAILRRVRAKVPKDDTDVYTISKYTFDTNKRMLYYENEAHQKLTTKEAGLLRLLCQYKGKVLERDIALKSVWGDDNYFTGRSMDVYVSKIRKYLKQDSQIEIQNIHGTGFMLIVHG